MSDHLVNNVCQAAVLKDEKADQLTKFNQLAKTEVHRKILILTILSVLFTLVRYWSETPISRRQRNHCEREDEKFSPLFIDDRAVSGRPIGELLSVPANETRPDHFFCGCLSDLIVIGRDVFDLFKR
ncbi:hypothetical protein TNCV_597231 [Trichonephila clavipes]|nr:hypothetical protein TNCV_597231 [Trichonephila clavipes]